MNRMILSEIARQSAFFRRLPRFVEGVYLKKISAVMSVHVVLEGGMRAEHGTLVSHRFPQAVPGYPGTPNSFCWSARGSTFVRYGELMRTSWFECHTDSPGLEVRIPLRTVLRPSGVFPGSTITRSGPFGRLGEYWGMPLDRTDRSKLKLEAASAVQRGVCGDQVSCFWYPGSALHRQLLRLFRSVPLYSLSIVLYHVGATTADSQY
eukprot:999242-Rhodomonas_salina.1